MGTWSVHATCVAFVLLVLVCSAHGGDVVRTARLTSDGVVDCSSVESIVAGIIKPAMTPRQKAEAVYDFVCRYRYHWSATREGPQRDHFEYGVVYDPVKLLNVYGYGLCFQTAAVLEALYQAAGLEARKCGIGGHAICEVYYDGKYHYYDADQQGYFCLPDGTVASMDQLSRDPLRLVVGAAAPRGPFFPAIRNPRVPYESKTILAAYFASRDNNYVQHDKFEVGHRMDLSLAPGMRLTRYFEPRGIWHGHPRDVESDAKCGYVDPAAGPRDPISGRTYGSGSLLWQPDLGRGTNEYRVGVWADENIVQDDRGLTPGEAGAAAWAVFRVRLPYVIAGAPGSWAEFKPVGAAVVSAEFTRAAGDAAAISVSIDGGRTWQPIWSPGTKDKPGPARAVADFSEQVAGRYEYLLRFELTSAKAASPCRLDRLSILTNFQLSPAALPAVRDGRTTMRFALGDATETTELVADLTSADTFIRDIQEMHDVTIAAGRVTSQAGRTGEFVCELSPPRPGAVAAVGVTAGCRREPGRLNSQDDIRVFVAENEPRTWRQIANDDVPDTMQHWSYFLNARATCAADTRRVFVKFSVTTAGSAAIQFIRLRLHWLPGQMVPRRGLQLDSPGLPIRGLRIEHGWQEGAAQKRFETVVKDAPSEYVIEAGPNVVNKWVTMEPVRDPQLANPWRADDPPVAPARPAPYSFLDARLRDEMQTLCRQVDQDPAKYLPKAAASKSEWLAAGAREALAMLKTEYPLKDAAFGESTLAAARGLLAAPANPASAPGRADDRATRATSRPASETDALFTRLQSPADRGHRATLAGALVLLGDSRGTAPLAEALRGDVSPPPELAAILLRTGVAAGRQAARTVMLSSDTYLKLRFLECVRQAGIAGPPDELLAGLSDPSQWVRQAVLRLCRGKPSSTARQFVARMAKEDAAAWLRDEAASMTP